MSPQPCHCSQGPWWWVGGPAPPLQALQHLRCAGQELTKSSLFLPGHLRLVAVHRIPSRIQTALRFWGGGVPGWGAQQGSLQKKFSSVFLSGHWSQAPAPLPPLWDPLDFSPEQAGRAGRAAPLPGPCLLSPVLLTGVWPRSAPSASPTHPPWPGLPRLWPFPFLRLLTAQRPGPLPAPSPRPPPACSLIYHPELCFTIKLLILGQ